MDTLIAALRNLNLEDNPKTIIICYRPIFNKDKTVSKYMLRETVETDDNYIPPKQTLGSSQIVSDFAPVFSRPKDQSE